MNSERSSQDINETFNQHLKQQIEGHLPKSYIYRFGYPNDTLQNAGIPCLPIELHSGKLKQKSQQENHPFDLSCVLDLPKAIQNPIAIFDSKTQPDSKVILTELSNREKHFVVAIRVVDKNTYGRNKLVVNEVRSLYPKETLQIIQWINQGNLMRYVDKNKAINWLGKRQSNSADVAIPINSLIRTAKIVKNFENPKIPERILQEKTKPIVKTPPPKKGRRI